MNFEICKRCNAKSVAFPGDPYCVDCLPVAGTDAQIARYEAEVRRTEASALDAKLAREEYRARTCGV